MEKVFLKIADELQLKGHEYYDRGERDKTAIFWELEAIFRKVAEKLEVKSKP